MKRKKEYFLGNNKRMSFENGEKVNMIINDSRLRSLSLHKNNPYIQSIIELLTTYNQKATNKNKD